MKRKNAIPVTEKTEEAKIINEEQKPQESRAPFRVLRGEFWGRRRAEWLVFCTACSGFKVDEARARERETVCLFGKETFFLAFFDFIVSPTLCDGGGIRYCHN